MLDKDHFFFILWLVIWGAVMFALACVDNLAPKFNNQACVIKLAELKYSTEDIQKLCELKSDTK